MKFKYRKLLLPQRSSFFGTSVLRPIIPVKISVGRRTLSYFALIDSGADFSIFDAEIGENLGLNIKSGPKEKFGGIQKRGNSDVGAVAYLHEVTIDIGGWGYKTKIGFSYDIANYGCGILGQKGFFNAFEVKFDLLKEEIELKYKLN